LTREQRPIAELKEVLSDFVRRRFVDTGLVKKVDSSAGVSGRNGRFWIVSSLKSCFRFVGTVSIVEFEPDSGFEAIAESASQGSRSESIRIPSSVCVLGKSCFQKCELLDCATFERPSRLERIEESAYSEAALNAIPIPSTVVVLGVGSFQGCWSVEVGSRLERIETSKFSASGIGIGFAAIVDCHFGLFEFPDMQVAGIGLIRTWFTI
jgi:hypothetical protein